MGTRKIVLIVPIAWKLERDKDNSIICGPGTREACDHAARLALALPGSEILLTPTRAGPKWNHVLMAGLMIRHIAQRYPELTLRYSEAPSFTTRGEVMATADFIRFCGRRSEQIEEVIFVAKSWHKDRLMMNVEAIFKAEGITVPVRYETHEVPASLFDRVLRESVARIGNRISLQKLGM